MILEADTNHDGVLDITEFVNSMKKKVWLKILIL